MLFYMFIQNKVSSADVSMGASTAESSTDSFSFFHIIETVEEWVKHGPIHNYIHHQAHFHLYLHPLQNH